MFEWLEAALHPASGRGTANAKICACRTGSLPSSRMTPVMVESVARWKSTSNVGARSVSTTEVK